MKSLSRKLENCFRFRDGLILLLCGAFVLVPSPAASAVDLDPEAYKASLAMGETPAGMEKITADIALFSDYVEVAVAPNGNFTMATRQGNPDTPNDDNANMLFGHPNPQTGATTLRVDGQDFWNYGAVDQIGTLLEAPATSGEVNSTVWTAGGVKLTQSLRLMQGGSGFLDALSMEYVVENTDSMVHEAGVRIFFDTQLGANDAAPFRVPNVGNVIQETDLSGDQVPDFWQSFDNLSNPNLQTQATLAGLQSTKPDRVVWANWGHLNDSPFDFTTTPVSINDSAVAMYWNPRPIQPGEVVRFVSYYGLGDIDLVQGDLSLGLTGPAALTFANGQYIPNPFTVFLFVGNDQPGTQTTAVNLTAEIGLSEGLNLAPGETAVHNLGDLPVGSDTQTAWQVLASGFSTGNLPYGVDVSADNIPTANIERTIFVPEGGAMPTPTPTDGIPVTPTPTLPPQGEVALHPGFEYGVPLGTGIVQSSIAIGDIDQDGFNEIVVGGFDGGLYAYNGDGTAVLEPPAAGLTLGELFHTPDGTPILSSPTLADVDSDHRLDILWGTDGGEVYRLELRLSTDPPIETKRAMKPGLRKSSPRAKLPPVAAEDDDPGR